ncbi:MAG: dTMP kinase [Eubacteriales bacterium]|nr:dTMP kinase [Eubacteriales bacterium]
MNTFPYDAVVFDLDGTLTCSEQGILQSVRYAMDKLGEEIPSGVDLRTVIGPPLQDTFRTLFGLPEDKVREGVALYRDYFNREGMYLYTVYPHIRSILRMLREGGAFVAIATSKPTAPTVAILEHFGLAHYFNRVVGEGEGDVQLGKPELIRRALPEKYQSAVMVGDRFYDVEGAAAAGVDSIGVEYGFGSEDELLHAGATHIVPDTEALRALLCPGAEVPRGFFLTMEGLDGCGKTTQADLLEKGLRDYGYSVLRTREPGGTHIGEDIRAIVLGVKNMEMCPACEALLYAASRAQHVHQVIRPAVEKGQVVLCDRFVDSSIAYQGGGRELGVELVTDINAPAVEGMMPDATVYLEMDHLRALERRHQASALDRIEVESAEFHGRVQHAYEKIIRENRRRFVVVDGDRDVDAIAHDVLRQVLNRLEPEIGE